MLLTGVLIGFSTAMLSSVVMHLFFKSPLSGKTFSADIWSGENFQNVKVTFRDVSKK